jgi:TetR/AcrR family transcriptional regulator
MAARVGNSPPKQTRNAEATRARILETARVEFVTNGLNGARVDRIAEQAGVNKNLIYHYFGSKDDLYLEVLEGIYAGLRAKQQDEDLRGKPPVAAMAQLVANMFDHFVATPELIRLMSVENIHYAQHLKRSTSIKPLYRGLLDTLEDLLRRGQANGSFLGTSTPSTSICRSRASPSSSCPTSTPCPGCWTGISWRSRAWTPDASTSSTWC